MFKLKRVVAFTMAMVAALSFAPFSSAAAESKVVCGSCGHAMTLSSTQNPRFQCTFTRSAVGAECHGLSVNAAELERMVFKLLTERLRENQALDYLAGSKTELGNSQLKEQKRTLYERYVLGEINADDYKTATTELAAEFAKLSRISVQAAEQQQIAIMQSLTTSQKLTRELADVLINKVCVHLGGSAEILWKSTDFSIKRRDKWVR